MIDKEILKQMGFRNTQENVWSFFHVDYTNDGFMVCFNGVRLNNEDCEMVIAEETTMENFFEIFFDFIHCNGQCYGQSTGLF